MIKKQDGSIFAVLLLVLVVSSSLFAFSLYNAMSYKQLFNNWTLDCINAGGIVGRVSEHGNECFINGKITTLPGYEQYSTGIKN